MRSFSRLRAAILLHTTSVSVFQVSEAAVSPASTCSDGDVDQCRMSSPSGSAFRSLLQVDLGEAFAAAEDLALGESSLVLGPPYSPDVIRASLWMSPRVADSESVHRRNNTEVMPMRSSSMMERKVPRKAERALQKGRRGAVSTTLTDTHEAHGVSDAAAHPLHSYFVAKGTQLLEMLTSSGRSGLRGELGFMIALLLIGILCCAMMMGALLFDRDDRDDVSKVPPRPGWNRATGGLRPSTTRDVKIPAANSARPGRFVDQLVRNAGVQHVSTVASPVIPASAPDLRLDGSRPPSLAGPPTSTYSPIPSVALSTDGRTLCPGLLVPKGSECVVAVPRRPQSVALREPASFSIRETTGPPVIEVELTPFTGSQGNERTNPMVVLRTVQQAGKDRTLIASARGSEMNGRRNAYIYDSHNELFAHLTKVMTPGAGSKHGGDMSKPCYVLTSGRMGLQWVVDGNFREHAIHIANEDHRMLADTEPHVMRFDPSGSFYKLRVSECVDVGLVLCALLSIDQMET